MNGDRTSEIDPDGQSENWIDKILTKLGFNLRSRGSDNLRELVMDAGQAEMVNIDALEMMKGVLDVAELQVRDVMIPRSQMVVIERDSGIDQLLPIIIDSAHSRFPVIGDNRDKVYGILLAKDLLPYLATKDVPQFNLSDILRTPLFIPESKRLNTLLRDFRLSHNHMAIVVDEYGGVSGLITIEDVLEQIVGKIEDEHDVDDDEPDIAIVSEGQYLVRALTSIDDFNDYFSTTFSDEEFVTIGGVITNAFGRMPVQGDETILQGIRFIVDEANERRIHTLQVSRVQEEEGESSLTG